jgi:NADPH:quinone reductase-like Zn-dependent oxidoreductase
MQKPKRVRILGQEFSGVVEKTGKSVSAFKPGDRVFGSPGIKMGTYARYLCMPETGGSGGVAHIPDDVDFKTAAVLTTGGMESAYFFDRSGIEKGDRVLINGAGGSIGTFFLQMAKNKGAHVTAVDRYEKLDFLKSLGADRTIDYEKLNFADENINYDVIFDVVGGNSLKSILKSLRRGGRYLLGNPTFPKIAASFFINMSSGKKVVVGGADYTGNRLEQLAGMVAERRIIIPIDREFSLLDIIEAHKYVDSGMKKGNVVVII